MLLVEISNDVLSQILEYLTKLSSINQNLSIEYKKDLPELQFKPHIVKSTINYGILRANGLHLGQDDILALLCCFDKHLCQKIFDSVRVLSIKAHNFKILKRILKLRTIDYCLHNLDPIETYLKNETLTKLSIDTLDTKSFELPINLTSLTVSNERSAPFTFIPESLTYLNINNLYENEFEFLPPSLTEWHFKRISSDVSKVFAPKIYLPNLLTVKIRSTDDLNRLLALARKPLINYFGRILESNDAQHILKNLPQTLTCLELFTACSLSSSNFTGFPSYLQKLNLSSGDLTMIKLELFPKSLTWLSVCIGTIIFGTNFDDDEEQVDSKHINMIASHLDSLKYLNLRDIDLEFVDVKQFDSLPQNLVEIRGMSDITPNITSMYRVGGIWTYY
jgi:hypothetical protein